MDYQVIPTIWEEDYEEVYKKLKGVEDVAERVLFDIMDGRFVRKYSWTNPHDLKAKKFDLNYEGHLMTKDPEDKYYDWIQGGLSRIYFHYDAMKDKPEVEDEYGRKLDAIPNLIKEIKGYKREVGIALLPDVDWQPIIDHMNDIDCVLLLTAKTWIKRRKFLEDTIPKVKSLRKFYEELDIAVQGCIDPENIESLKEAGANTFYVNDYIWESDDPEEAFETLQDIVKEEDEDN